MVIRLLMIEKDIYIQKKNGKKMMNLIKKIMIIIAQILIKIYVQINPIQLVYVKKLFQNAIMKILMV